MYSRYKAINAITLSMIILWTPLLVVAQTATKNAAKIRDLRTEIKKREQTDIPEDLRELNQAILIERRAQLRTALQNEIESLKKQKAELGTFLTPEEDQKIASSIQGYEAEIQSLGGAITKDLTAAISPTGPTNVGNGPSQPTPTPQAAPSATPIATATPTATPKPSLIAPVSAQSAAGPPPKIRCSELSNLSPAEQKGVPQVEFKICDLVRVVQQRKVSKQPMLSLTSGTPDYFDLLVVMIAKKSTPTFLVEAVEADTSTQVGSGPSSEGTTSLVVRGGAPAVLGFAVENGVLSRSISGTNVTFRGNPMGIFHALKNHGFFESAIEDEKDPITKLLRRTSFAFTFDTSRGTEPGVFTGTKQQLSSFSGRIELVNRRRPDLYVKEWNDFLSTKVVAFTETLRSSKPVLVTTESSVELKWRDEALQQWYADTQAALASAGTDGVESVLRARLDKLPIADLSPITVAQLAGIEQQIEAYLTGRDEVLDKIAKGTLVTFEYTNKREVNAPDTSNFTLIAEKGTGGRVDLTFNASLTMFNNLDALRNFVALNPTLPAPRRLRDFQFAGQIDVPIGSVRNYGQFVFFAGGRYERLLENATTDLGEILPNTKGDIGHLQLGLKVPIKGTGFTIPFSVTFANRTELVKERTVRGNFGFTLDLDTLFAKFKPF